MSKKKYKIEALGCRTNQYEAQAFQKQLDQLGYTLAAEGEEADVCIVNTCTVTESADGHSRHAIRGLIKKNPQAKVFVTGCFAERDPEAVGRIDGVTAVVPNADKEMLLAHLHPEEELPEFTINQFAAHTRAFVKVQDGCNSFCTYCIIPYVRGRSRSRSIASVVQEVEGLIANGFKEVVITGINVGDFDGGVEKGAPKETLAQLIRAVDAIPGLERLRISSIDPDEVDDELMDAVIGGKHTCRSMHIVLQSGSNVILKRMNRKYTRQIFMETVDRLRGADPDFTFTTDVIVGFPGETDVDFQETLEVMEEVKFAKVHMFPFSPRPRTRAALMPNQLPPELIRERKQRVLHVAEQHAHALREQYIGRRMTILTEGQEGSISGVGGHTDNFLYVEVPEVQISTNQLVEVRLTGNNPTGLIGEVVSSAMQKVS